MKLFFLLATLFLPLLALGEKVGLRGSLDEEDEARPAVRRLRVDRWYAAGKILPRLLAEKCTSDKKFYVISSTATSMVELAGNLKDDIMQLPGNKDAVRIAHLYADFMHESAALVVDALAECWARKLTVGSVFQLVDSGVLDAMGELADATFPPQRINKEMIPVNSIVEATGHMIDGAQAMLTTLTEGGTIGLRELKQAGQKDATLVMLRKWRRGVVTMKQATGNLGGKIKAWEILETSLNAFIGKLAEDMA